MKSNSTKYEKLPKLIKHKRQGYDYHLIKRKGDVAWYEARYLNGNETQGYVVAKIRRAEEEVTPRGHTLPPREVFPRQSYFGKDGWFYMPRSRPVAETHFKDLADQWKGGGK